MKRHIYIYIYVCVCVCVCVCVYRLTLQTTWNLIRSLLLIFAVFQYFYLFTFFIPKFLAETLTIVCRTLGVKGWIRDWRIIKRGVMVYSFIRQLHYLQRTVHDVADEYRVPNCVCRCRYNELVQYLWNKFLPLLFLLLTNLIKMRHSWTKGFIEHKHTALDSARFTTTSLQGSRHIFAF